MSHTTVVHAAAPAKLRGDDVDIPWGLLDKGAALGTLIFLTLAWIKGGIVSGREHRETREDRDYWRETALTALGSVRKIADHKEAALASLESVERAASDKEPS